MKDFLILPTYNERENIKPLIETIFKLLPNINITVVDDSSPDGTARLVIQMKQNFPNLQLLLREKKEGLGKAYISAFRELLKNREIGKLVTMDADFSHSPENLPEMLNKARHYDFVIGSRYTAGGAIAGWELWRSMLSRCANLYCRVITGMQIHDCTAGFQIVDASVLRKVDFSKMDSSGYAFLMELKYLISKTGASIKEIPIVFKNRVGGESKISSHIIREGILAPWKIRMKK